MKSKGRRKTSKTTKIIAINTLFVIFTLANAFVGTVAWFQAHRQTESTVGSFEISAPPGVEFDLYYLDSFSLQSSGEDGNWNEVIDEYSGYETDYENALFQKVEYDGNGAIDTTHTHGKDPTGINQLWPAHKLTFALLITSGEFGGLTIDSWDEDSGSVSPVPMIGADTPVKLSWAIDIYGGVFYADGADVSAALSAGFVSYRNAAHVDAFPSTPQSTPTSPLSVISGASITGTGSYTIAYFTIEFSDSPSTWYSESTPYYLPDSVGGNSNCYEGLRLTELNFKVQ